MRALLNPSTVLAGVVLAGSWFQSLMVLGKNELNLIHSRVNPVPKLEEEEEWKNSVSCCLVQTTNQMSDISAYAH
jgi:hypothetical protein